MSIKILKEKLSLAINNSIVPKKYLLESSEQIDSAIKLITKSLNRGGKIILCGNGGSAADAQHLAAEFLVRLRPKVNRKPFAAISLAQDSSTITACSNDFSFEKLFSRNLEALGNKKDILLAISTSGKSKNIVNALKKAKDMKISSIGFYGNTGGNCKKLTTIPILVKSTNTANIQETHIFLGHFIFEQVEKLILKK